MSLAASMRSLVEDIQASTKDRHTFVGDTIKDVKELLTRFDKEQADIVKELKEMAAEVKKFLTHSEKARKEDFAVMMEDIAVRLDEIGKWQKDIRKDTRELVKEFADERKKAREYWLSLRGGHRKPGRPREKEE